MSAFPRPAFAHRHLDRENRPDAFSRCLRRSRISPGLSAKLSAHIQSRWGPYRVGPHGLLQPLADGLKFITKEDPLPRRRG